MELRPWAHGCIGARHHPSRGSPPAHRLRISADSLAVPAADCLRPSRGGAHQHRLPRAGASSCSPPEIGEQQGGRPRIGRHAAGRNPGPRSWKARPVVAQQGLEGSRTVGLRLSAAAARAVSGWRIRSSQEAPPIDSSAAPQFSRTVARCQDHPLLLPVEARSLAAWGRFWAMRSRASIQRVFPFTRSCRTTPEALRFGLGKRGGGRNGAGPTVDQAAVGPLRGKDRSRLSVRSPASNMANGICCVEGGEGLKAKPVLVSPCTSTRSTVLRESPRRQPAARPRR